jgi:predicted permease
MTVLLFTLSVSLFSGLMFGLAAVLRFSGTTAGALKEGGRSATDGRHRQRTRNALVVGQLALALTLLIVSGLMVRTFAALRVVDPGFTQPSEVQTFVVAIPPALIADAPQAARTHQQIAGQLAAVPGVESVGMSSSITMDGEDNGNVIEIEGIPRREGELPPLRRFKSFGAGYFETMGIRLVAGRSITWDEMLEQRPLVIISAPLAHEYWGEPSRALGKRIRGSGRSPWREIVGVSAEERDDGLNRPATPIVYWPMPNESYRWRNMAYVVRSSRVGTPGFMRELERAAWSVNANLPLAAPRSVADIQEASMTQTSFALVMLGIAAAVAFLIGIVGIYGAVACTVAQRTREIGIRVALGADLGHVRQMFLRQGLRLTAAGIAGGIAIALLVTRVMSAMLFGVGTMDPLTYLAVSGVMAAVALLATYLPARRASRVDPIIALRTDV